MHMTIDDKPLGSLPLQTPGLPVFKSHMGADTQSLKTLRVPTLTGGQGPGSLLDTKALCLFISNTSMESTLL